MYKKIVGIFIVGLFIGAGIVPCISGNVIYADDFGFHNIKNNSKFKINGNIYGFSIMIGAIKGVLKNDTGVAFAPWDMLYIGWDNEAGFHIYTHLNLGSSSYFPKTTHKFIGIIKDNFIIALCIYNIPET